MTEVLDEALAIAERLAAGSRTAVQWTKRVMNQWLLQAAPVFGESLALEMLGFLGPDAPEGMAGRSVSVGAPSSPRPR